MRKVLIVDDEFLIRLSLEEGLKDRGYEAKSAATVKEALEILKQFRPQVVLLDNRLEHSLGMDEIATFRAADEEVQIILMTAYGSVSQAVEATKRGAYDYVLKPFDIDEIHRIIGRCMDQMKSRESLEFLKGETRDFVGVSDAAVKIRKNIAVLAKNSGVNVLIRGETGTGKEVAAALIHSLSDRRDGLMVRISCSAIPEHLLESELFGYERGAFAGAMRTKKGLFELAAGGTVFLDEIGELPLSMQTKLLAFLDHKKFKRVGGLEDIEVDARVIAATSRNLEQAVKRGEFREDLFYRINVMELSIPPLRERREDIPALCEYYLDYYNRQFGRSIRQVDPDFMRELLLYDWKGNVRELKNIFERCFLFCEGDVLTKQVELRKADWQNDNRTGAAFAIKDLKEGPVDLEQEVAALEHIYMDQALKLSGNNLTRAASLLGITRFSMRRKLDREE